MDMFVVFKFGPWGIFKYVKVIVRCVDEDGTSFSVLKI
jgi:hypothetical protein